MLVTRTHLSELVWKRLQLYALGRDEQRPALHTHPPLDRLDPGVDPDLPRPLAPLPGRERLLGHRVGPHDVEVGRQRGALVRDVQAGRERALAAGGQVAGGGARAVLVQDGGDEAAVDDARPADGAGPEVDDGDGLAGPVVVPDVLVPADAAGPAQGAGREAPRPGGGGGGGAGGVVVPRQALVGVVVAGGPVRVGEEAPHDGEVGRGLADVGEQGGVDLGAGDEGRGRGEHGAEAGAGRGAQEEEEDGGYPATPAASGWRWGVVWVGGLGGGRWTRWGGSGGGGGGGGCGCVWWDSVLLEESR